jgi:hypothetical protein
MSPFPYSRESNIKPRLKQRIFDVLSKLSWYKIHGAPQIQWAELSDELLLVEQATGSNEV